MYTYKSLSNFNNESPLFFTLILFMFFIHFFNITLSFKNKMNFQIVY
jgi:hypothetical protein